MVLTYEGVTERVRDFIEGQKQPLLTCPSCNGYGETTIDDGTTIKCEFCDGKGKFRLDLREYKKEE